MTGAEGEFEAIVLAAGTGSRFGGGKLLAPWRGGMLLDGALGAAFAAPVGRVIVATGAEAERVSDAVQSFALQRGHSARLRLVHAEDYAEGMGASLRKGVSACSSNAAGVFVFLGDMPRVPVSVLEPLALAVRAGASAAAPQFGGRRGNPVLMGSGLIPKLRALSGDEGARSILKTLTDLALVDAPDDGVLFDVDERGDLDG